MYGVDTRDYRTRTVKDIVQDFDKSARVYSTQLNITISLH